MSMKYSISKLCKLAGVSRSGYYKWINYDLSLRNDVKLVQNTLNKLSKMNLSANCILHTNQGFQYTRREYLNFLKKIGVIQSTLRKANC